MQAMTTTSHKTAALTAASALALWDAAESTADKVRAGAAMADVLRTSATKAPKKKATGPSDVLNAENLAASLKRLTVIVERRASIPILSTVLIKSKDGRLTLYATDRDMIYSEVLRAPGLPPFRMAVNAAALAGALRGASGDIAFRDDTVKPEPGSTYETYERGEKATKPRLPDYFLTVTADGLEVKLPGFAPADFPIMKAPQLPEGAVGLNGTSEAPPHASATLPAADLLDILGFVKPAISTEETRYYLNGAYMHATVEMGQTYLNCVATDGSRLLKASLEGGGGFQHTMPGVIIPRKAVDWLLRNLKDDEVQVDVWPEQIRFTSATGCFQTKLIDGSFPDYQRVIPGDQPRAALYIDDGKAAGAAIKRVTSQGAATRCKSVQLRWGKGAAEIMLNESSKATTAMPGVSFSGDASAIDLDFNGDYLREMIETGSPVEMVIYGANDPAKFTWPGRPGRLGVVMPLRRA
jgi:DNA polymerase-3 subunit beta